MPKKIPQKKSIGKRKRKLKNVLLLFCGGTISMHKDKKTGASDVSYGAEQLFKLEPRLVEVANVDVMFIENIDSTNMLHTHWEKLIDTITTEYKNYDGFLITMGTNTMAYTSSALSFAFTNLGKPVILTGAQIPAEIISSDGRNNLVNALRVAAMDLGGVFVVFGSKIILGCRAKKVSESDLDAFKTFNDRDFGEISIAVKINKPSNKRHSWPLLTKNGFEDNVVCLTLIPGLRAEFIIDMVDNGVKGIVLRAYGSGDIPYNLFPALLHAQQKKIPVVVTTQCPGGATAIGLNNVGLQALDTGIIQAFDMSMEAMSTKLMWLLGQKVPYQGIKDMMYKDLQGEVNDSTAKLFLSQHEA